MNDNLSSNLDKQFKLVWNLFVKQIVNEFQRNYSLDIGNIKKTKKIQLYIENIIQENLGVWNDQETYQGIFLNILKKKFPSVTTQFYEQLNNLQLKSKYMPVAYWSKAEILGLLGGLVVGIMVLLWGQNIGKLTITFLDFRQGLVAVTIIYICYRTIKKIRDNRIYNQIELNAQQLNDDLQQNFDALLNTISLVKWINCVNEI